MLSTLLVLGQVERENAGEDQQVVVRPSGSTPPSSGKGGSVTSSGYRHVTLALLAHAFLVGTRAKATGDGAKGGRGRLTSQLGLLPLTVPEVLRLLVTLVWTSPIPPGFVLAWSRWRRRHQARARRAHHQRRNNTCGWSTDPPAFDTLTFDCSISGTSVDEWAF